MKAKRGGKPVKLSEKVNPFEVKVNRQKHDVLGRKSKSDRGLLGVSRNKAIKKRKATLLQEYVLRNKSSTFMDKRIGEFDAAMNPDDKMAARLAQERKISQKKNVFSLNEEEELTHLGKSINDMETHDDPRSDDEDLYDKVGRDFTEKTNFGGFLTKADPNSDAAKSRRDAIEQLIAESKKLKYERQVEKDENFELTEKLDKDWKEFQSLLAGSKNKKSAAEEASTDDYDVLVKQLKFAPLAGQASERVKTEDEKAKAEKKRLEKLEQERKARAQGTEAKKDANKKQLASADDLDDSFYKRERITETTKQSDSDEDEFEETDRLTGVESKDESDVSAGSDSEGGDEDSYADLESDKEASSDNEELKDDTDNVTDANKASVPVKDENRISEKHVKPKEMDAVKKKSTIADVPDTEEEFSRLVEKKTACEKAALIEHMIKNSQGSCKKLERLFVYLLQHISDIADTDIHVVDKLCPHIYSLVQLSPTVCGQFLLDVISEKEEELQNLLSGKGRFSVSFPSFSTLVFLKLIGQCYSASDFSHMVATPAMLFASHLLTCCGLKKPVDFLRGIFVANVFLEYVSYSRRFSPELLAFLAQLLSHNALKLKDEGNAVAVDESELKLPLKALGSSEVEMTEDLKLKIVHAGVKLVERCACLYETLPSYRELCDSLIAVCQKLTESAYPESLRAVIGNTLSKLSCKIERKPLKPSKKPPPMKPLLEPKFSMKFDGRKHFSGGEKKVELKKLNYQYKKEMKGAMREVRRDNQFLAQHILKEQMAKDAERKEKVKRIYKELASQEGEYKALEEEERKTVKSHVNNTLGIVCNIFRLYLPIHM
ncbi:nucleolar protein 14 [Rhipicephalus sanguineus]|uniref:nucleolar protein 14 n=1 Tax=Rhipicephalus sanguineus TaxID=34632 RepID=UPI00189624A2|nr:nucleolar protein 14 [Rhipicephalus sanguineus]